MQWVEQSELPCPVVAGITHYQFATIHPYYDGNGRMARLLTTFILHRGGYDLKGIYSLEEYYARNLEAYYQAIGVGPSHNYYLGRVEADISGWIDYFLEGMAQACERVLGQLENAAASNLPDCSSLLRNLDPRQRRVLGLFQEFSVLSSRQIGGVFGLQARGASRLCAQWVQTGFLKIVNPSKKARRYTLADAYQDLAL